MFLYRKFVPIDLKLTSLKKKYDGNKIAKWNIDGLSDCQIIQTAQNMFIYVETLRVRQYGCKRNV